MVFQFLLWRKRSGGRNKKFWMGAVGERPVFLVRRHVEKHMFDVARLVEELEALGEARDMVF